MSKMSEISITLREYEENLHAYGHMDGLVRALKKELLDLDLEMVRLEVLAIDHEFDTLVFNGDLEDF